jgi:hypothetical protein
MNLFTALAFIWTEKRFRLFQIDVKVAIIFRSVNPSVCLPLCPSPCSSALLSSCTSATLIGLIFIKFHIGDVYENLSITTNLVKIKKNIGWFILIPEYVLSSIDLLSEGTRNAPWGWKCNAETCRKYHI